MGSPDTAPRPTDLSEDATLLGDGTTLVEGTTFCVASDSGDVEPDLAQGLFVEDTRVLSRWRLLVDGAAVEPLSSIPAEPYEATFVGRAAPRAGRADATIVVERRRLVGSGMREDLTLRNFSAEAAGVHVALEVDADFADLFEVKDGHPARRPRVGRRAVGDELVLWLDRAGTRRGVRVTAPGVQAGPDGLAWRVVVPAQGEWRTTVEVRPSVAEQEMEAGFPTDRPVESSRAARRMQVWHRDSPTVRAARTSLQNALVRSERDLGALRILDRDHPEDDVVAAGAPWFMALFGRDSLLTGWMTLPAAPGLALGTLRTLARRQGRRHDPMTEEDPGKILHEVRLGMDASLALGGDSVYFGSVDATPLFVMLVDRAARWGAPRAELEALMPAVDAAMDWLVHHGDADGDGFVEYARRTDRGLINQGWKDSFDGVASADGTIARAPVALAEVQGYAYAAMLARAHLADMLDDPATATRWRERARDLAAAFDEAFWMPEHGTYALALDHRKQQVDAVTSNVGHCLWTGIVPRRRAEQVADALLSPAMFTGFGIRTLAQGMAAYNPVSYHNGSVWPHDTTIAAAGLARYGMLEHARRVVDGLLDAAHAFQGRLPELFCGFDRADKPVPVPFPTSCSPQAWAAASPFELLRTALQVEPCVPHAALHLGERSLVGDVRITDLPLGRGRLAIEADADGIAVSGLPDGVGLTTGGRPACDPVASDEVVAGGPGDARRAQDGG